MAGIRILRLLLGALLVPLTLGALAAPAEAARLGAVTDVSWGISATDLDRTVAKLKEARVPWVRVNASWKGLEPNAKGQYDAAFTAQIDAAVTRLRAAGIEVLMPIADGVPYWASADPRKAGGSWNHMWMPSEPADYGDFVTWVVRRYGPMGVRHFEIWNEPNLARFWPSGVDAAAYVRLLREGHRGVKSADPAATVVLGGLSKNDATYLRQLYAAGAGAYFDVAAVHPYSGSVSPATCWTDATGRQALDAFCGVDAVRDVMVANGDSGKSLWLTELGWTTTSGTYGVTEAQQAAYLTALGAEIDKRPWIGRAFWYAFRNTYWLQDEPTSWEANVGVLRTDFTAKPAFAAMSALNETNAVIAPTVEVEPAPTATVVTGTVPATTTTTSPTIENVTTTTPTTTTKPKGRRKVTVTAMRYDARTESWREVRRVAARVSRTGTYRTRMRKLRSGRYRFTVRSGRRKATKRVVLSGRGAARRARAS